MSVNILSDQVKVYYLDENRQKRLEWIGTATGTVTANELYSACADLMDESTQMDDGSVMSAETPVEYTIGSIDSGDLDPWYISYDCMEHVTGGAIKTSSWARVQDSNTGIVVISVTSNTIDSADIGYTITHDTDSDSGTLLDVIEAGTTDYLIVRPDSDAAANNFDSTSGGLTCNSATATQAAAATTGEQIWANFYTVTPIDADTHVYAYQGLVSDATRARIASITDSTQDWWGEGSLDRCIYIRNFKAASAPIIDGGYVTFLVRKGNTLYDSFELQASNTSGGRNPVPLSASADLNNTTGYKSITYTNASTTGGHWNVGDEILGGTSGARGIITQIDNPGATQTVHYYLIGDPQTDFQTAAETCNNQDAGGTGSKNGSAPAAQGPALSAWFTNNTAPTISHANTTVDIDDDGTAEGYAMTIDCNQNPLDEVYEWLKYITRNGETSTGSTDGIEGEQYEGATVYLKYSGSVSGGTIDEGEDVLQATSGATGIVISHDTSNKQIVLRNTRGTFNTTNTVTSQDVGAGSVTPDTAATTFTPVKSSPFGTFAGGTFFGARGVALSDWVVASDENSFQLTDSSGTVRTRPQSYTISVTNLTENGNETVATSDRVGVFRLTGAGGAINKTEYSGTAQSAGATTCIVGEAITTDTPGKSTGGVLRIRDNDNSNAEYRLRYSSWDTSTFTLANTNLTGLVADATTSTTQIVDAAANFQTNGVKRGDLVRNVTAGGIGYVVTVDSESQITTTTIASQASGDTYDINTLPITTTTSDDVFVSLLDKHATAATEAVSIIVGSQIEYRVVVRNVAATTKIKPFTTDDAILNSNRSVATIRTTDTIYA